MRTRRGFEFKTVNTDAGVRTVARFNCYYCENQLDIANTTGKTDEWFAANARSRGWQADARKIAKCRCPDCIKRPAVPVIAVPAAVEQRPENKGVISMAEFVLRELTADQRHKVRELLDKHFDDATGIYLDDMTDQKIGAMLNLSWSHVSRIREAAYGPIRSDQETMKLQTQLSECEKDLKNLKQAADDLARQRVDLDTRVTALRAAVDGLARRKVA